LDLLQFVGILFGYAPSGLIRMDFMYVSILELIHFIDITVEMFSIEIGLL